MTYGLAEELEADLLLFESIDEIAGNLALEPGLGGRRPCAALEPESPEAPLARMGVRNSEKAKAFTFLPSGVTDFPRIDGITPEQGSEIGGNTVIIVGQQFDAFSVDLSDPTNPGFGIECPPDSGHYIAPLRATLVDRQTIAITMPPCEVDVPRTVNFCMRNKYSMDHKSEINGAGPFGDCVVFEDIYTYIPVPPIEPPVLTAIFPSSGNPQPQGEGADYGLQRLMVLGDWFDTDTALNGGFEFLLPNGEIIQSLRTVFHNRNLIEVYTKRLPDSVFPLTEDLIADVRLRNTIGYSDHAAAFIFRAMPDAEEAPVLDEIFPTAGPAAGGNKMMVFGSNFDTTTDVRFNLVPATDVQFITSGLLIATVPGGVPGATVSVSVVDDEDVSDALPYTYMSDDGEFGEYMACPAVGLVDPDEGSSTGGYDVLVYGIDLGPLTRFEFEVGSNNFSGNPFFISDNLVRVTVPEALPDQVGATVGVGATDPLRGCDEALRTADFTYLGFGPPEIYFVQTTEVDPITPTDLPALNVGGGDRMLVIGKNFDQTTFFDITKPQISEEDEDSETSETTDLVVLTPNLAVMTSPASPDGLPGLADLVGHNSFGDSDPFAVEYVEPGPPEIIDVRNLDDGTQSAPIDGNDRLLIFGDNFYEPVVVRLTGCDLDPESEGGPLTVTLTSPDVTVLSDHILGVNVPANTFCEGPLDIEVQTNYGVADFSDEAGPLFQLLGPQPPRVDGVFPTTFNSLGGEEAIFFGRNLTETTDFSVRTDLMPTGYFEPVYNVRWVSETTVLVTMPALPGGIPEAAANGDVRAEEMDTALRNKIAGDPFTVSEDLFVVLNDESPVLLSVFPDTGTIDGGQPVLLLGAHFLTATGTANIDQIFFDEDEYVASDNLIGDPLNANDAGEYIILNDHEILLITLPTDVLSPEDTVLAVDVTLVSDNGNSTLNGGYNYVNTPAVRTPFLLGLTPNETRLNGETSHLLSGGFLTEADRIVLEKPTTSARLTIPVDSGSFSEINDNFLVFEMPDLSGTFSAGDQLTVYAEKDVNSVALRSNKLTMALRVTFAGPPTPVAERQPGYGPRLRWRPRHADGRALHSQQPGAVRDVAGAPRGLREPDHADRDHADPAGRRAGSGRGPLQPQ